MDFEEKLTKINQIFDSGAWTASLIAQVGNHEGDLTLSPEEVARYWRNFFDARAGRWDESLRQRLRERRVFLYVHVPYCYRKCGFCTYHVAEGVMKERTESYVDSLLASIRFYAPLFAGKPLRGMYIGGGTPSVLDDAQWSRVLGQINSRFRFFRPENRAIELNPASTTPSKLDVLYAHGIRRVSFGVQSLEREVLRRENRPWHSPDRVGDLVSHARRLGVSVNVDLIFGLPDDQEGNFFDSLRTVLKTDADQISLYTYRAPSLERFSFDEHEERVRRRTTADQRIAQMAREAGFRVQGFGHDSMLVRKGLGPVVRIRRFEYPQQVHHTDDSVLGLGDGAESKVYGQVAYKEASLDQDFDPGRGRYRGTALSERDEMRRFVMSHLQGDGRVSLQAFYLRYGKTMAEVFGGAIRGAMKTGAFSSSPLALRFKTDQQRERAIAIRLFTDDEFVERWLARAQRLKGSRAV